MNSKQLVSGFLIAFLFMFFSTISCSKKTQIESTTPPLPIDNFKQPDLYSFININYKIKKKGVVDTMHFVLDDIFKTQFDIPEQNAIVKLKRRGNVTVDIVGKDFLLTLPLDVDVLKKTFIKDLKMNGSLDLQMKTNISIDKYWNLSTITTLVKHTWVKRPNVDLGIIDLPIETLANFILKQSRANIERSVDESVKQQYDLKAIMKETSSMMLTPFELDSVFGGWIQMQSDSAFMSSAINSKDYTEGKMSMKTKMNLTSIRPVNNYTSLPIFSWKENIKDSSLIKILMEVGYDHLTQIAKRNFVGQTFSEGGRSIKILDISIGKMDGKLQVLTKVEGSFNGTLSVMGVPSYNNATGLLTAKNIDISVSTKNMLHKAAAWLIEGKMRKEIDKMIQFPIQQNVANVQNQIDDQISAMNKKYHLNMKVKLGSVKIDNIILRPDRLNCYTGITLKIDTVLDDLSFFRD